MIIKTMRCKHKSDINRLVDYILSDKERIREINDTFFIAQNMYARDSDGFKAAFYENEKYRKKRKNGVVLYHEVLAFSAKDKIRLDELEDLTQKYIELRAKDAVVLAKPHLEEQHYHVHILISGTACRSAKVMRMDNKRFAFIRKSIERYQLQKYPHLQHSIVHVNTHEKNRLRKNEDKNRRKEKGYQAQKRMGRHKKLDKEKLSHALLKMLDYSESKDDFMRFLKQENLELYLCRGKAAGVVYKNRKYRFRTLGIEREQLLALEQGKKERIKEVPQHNLTAVEPFIAEYQQRLKHLLTFSEKKQHKQLKVLVQNILNKSYTYNQFLFYVHQVGFYTYKKAGVVKGISLNYQEYSFWNLGVWEQVVRLRALQKQRDKRKQERENEIRQRDIGVSSALDLGLDFLL